MSKSVLLLSAYDAVSHRLWRERLCASFPQWQWTCLHLSPRHFAWRIRSNGIHWAYKEQAILQQPYDLLIATSMVDLATLRGLQPQLAKVPTMVYFHENQFAYPAGNQRADNVEPKLVPIYSALCAEKIVFNSDYNRQSFLQGVDSLSHSLPESIPNQAMAQLRSAEVIPVALPAQTSTHRPPTDPDRLTVLWNHRWEYDKGPELLLAIVQACIEQQLRICFHIVGQQFRTRPGQFSELERLLQDQAIQGVTTAGHFGYLPDDEYRALLPRCDVVLSTALHDFQGLAIQEACQAGCSPLAPRALAYPEYLPEQCLYERQQSIKETAQNVSNKFRDLGEQKRNREGLAQVDLQRFSAESVKAQHLALFRDMGLLTDETS